MVGRQGVPYRYAMSEIHRDDLAAAVAARRELGGEYDDPIVAGLADKIEAEIARRSDPHPRPRGQSAEVSGSGHSLALAIVSLGVSIPLTACALAIPTSGQLVYVVIIWAAIVAVNVAFNRRR